MKNGPYKYIHIISRKIKTIDYAHPLENIKDKTEMFYLLQNDLQINDFEDISEGKKNLFRIYQNHLYYNIFIEFPDGGGRDISFNGTSKKVSIPFHQKSFQKLIDNYERVLVINIYVPLDEQNCPIFSERVYLIVKPKEIYSSKVFKNKTSNPSSRWVKLEEILDILNNKIYKCNSKQNVYIVHWEKIRWFFDNILKTEYANMINSELTNIKFTDLNEENGNKYKKYRQLFREKLILERGIKCEIIGCKIKTLELMIASHIKPVHIIIKDKTLNEEQKNMEISDTSNGFLLCPNHDKLFDKFLITFDSKGFLKISNTIIHESLYLNLINSSYTINVASDGTAKYLEFHNVTFNLKNK